MTKTRMPDTFEDAALDAVRALGDAQAAMLCNVSRQVMRDYSDPDRDGRPAVHNALLLDCACMAAIGRAPFLEAYGRQFQARTMGMPQRTGDVLAEALDLPTAVGRLIDIIRASTAINSESGRSLSVNEATKILREIKAHRLELDEVEAAVKQSLGGER